MEEKKTIESDKILVMRRDVYLEVMNYIMSKPYSEVSKIIGILSTTTMNYNDFIANIEVVEPEVIEEKEHKENPKKPK